MVSFSISFLFIILFPNVPDFTSSLRRQKWKVGVPLFFDDSYEHSVWNNTGEDRVVLLFDVWSSLLIFISQWNSFGFSLRHPDLVPEEIEAIVTMLQEA